MTQINSLIVDNNPHSRFELKYLLESHACINVVGETESSSSGLCLTRELQPDLVFLDIIMPEYTGIELFLMAMVPLKLLLVIAMIYYL